MRTGPLNPAFVYTNIGKTWHDPTRSYGTPIELDHPNAISIAVGINPESIKMGPVLPMVTEIMRVYTQLATISTTLAGYIRRLGYEARAHIISNYQVLCVPIAIEAGMGELGRHGLMITKELGSCLKLTTVTTTLPLLYDPPADIGVDEFCEACKICAESCPSGAIPHGKRKSFAASKNGTSGRRPVSGYGKRPARTAECALRPAPGRSPGLQSTGWLPGSRRRIERPAGG